MHTTKTHRAPQIAAEVDLTETYVGRHRDPYGPKVTPLRDDLREYRNHAQRHHPACDCQSRVRSGIPVPAMTPVG